MNPRYLITPTSNGYVLEVAMDPGDPPGDAQALFSFGGSEEDPAEALSEMLYAIVAAEGHVRTKWRGGITVQYDKYGREDDDYTQKVPAPEKVVSAE